MLTGAGRAWQAMTGEETPRRLFDPGLVASRCSTVECANGASLHVTREFDKVRDPDLVIVSSILVPPPELTARLDERFLALLRLVYRRGSTVASVCSGSLALAEAGLLDGLEATTH